MKVQFFCKKRDTIPQAAVRKSRSCFGINLSFFCILSINCMIFFAQPMRAESVPPEMRGSGDPLPRFASISSNKAFVRSGPAPRYPIKWVYKKDGLPVEVIQEFDVWRKIRDRDGDEGWINQALLSKNRSAVVQGQQIIDMREGINESSRIMARLEPGVIGRIQKCDTGWCRLSVGGFEGWVEQRFLWGVYPQEAIE